MNKPLFLALSVLLLGLKFAIPVDANCGSCEADKAAPTTQCHASDKAKCDASAKAECDASAKCESSAKKSLEARVSSVEQSLKDVGSCKAAGTPFTSKAQGSKAAVCPYTQKSSDCPMAKCPKRKCDKAKTCPKAKAKSSDAS